MSYRLFQVSVLLVVRVLAIDQEDWPTVAVAADQVEPLSMET